MRNVGEVVVYNFTEELWIQNFRMIKNEVVILKKKKKKSSYSTFGTYMQLIIP